METKMVEVEEADVQKPESVVPSKREILQDITYLESNQTLTTTTMHGHHDKSELMISLSSQTKKQRIQPPKISLDKLKQSQAESASMRKMSQENIFKQARLSAGFDSGNKEDNQTDSNSTVTEGHDRKTVVQEYMTESETIFKSHLLELQIQRDKYAQDSLNLCQSIDEMEYGNKRIKNNTQRLKEELYEIDSKIDEMQILIMNVRAQNMKKFKLKEKSYKLESQELENKLAEELHNLERELKQEYEDVILKYDDKIATQEITDLKTLATKRQEEYSSFMKQQNQELNDYQREMETKYEQSLTSLELPLEELNQQIERKKNELNDLKHTLNESVLEKTQLINSNNKMKNEIENGSKSLTTTMRQFEESSTKLNLIEQEYESKLAVFNTAKQCFTEQQQMIEKKERELFIEVAQKRRILHQIHELQGKLYVSLTLENPSKLDCEIISNDTNFQKESLRYKNQIFEFSSIFTQNDITNISDELQCFFEESLRGYQVSFISINGDNIISKPFISHCLKKLNDKSKSERKSIESVKVYHSILDNVLQTRIDEVRTEEFKTVGDIPISVENNASSICECSLVADDNTILGMINFINLTDFSASAFRNMVKNIKNQEHDSLIGEIYSQSKTRTLIGIPTSSSSLADDGTLHDWLEAASEMNRIDDTGHKLKLA